MNNPFSLENKTVLITGASSGIGRATAVECSKLGARTILTARNEERLEETLGMLDGSGHMILPADLTKEQEISSLAEKVPVLDGVVNNAGIGTRPTFLRGYSQEKLENVFVTNTFAPMLTMRWLLKKNRLSGSASVVFTSSISAVVSTPCNGMYGCSKAALTAYMKYCAKELGSKGIRANAVLPGIVESNFHYTVDSLGVPKIEECPAYILGRLGKPEDVAYAIMYFLSDASSWVTGASLTIDGGSSLIS